MRTDLPLSTMSPAVDPLRARALEAMRRAAQNLGKRQEERGSWAGDYGGPMFLLPMHLALCELAGQVPGPEAAAQMVTYFFNVQRKDGSFGLHAESTSGSMFTSVLGYVSLRILGQRADEPRLLKLLDWIHANGGAVGAASWGKFTLCLLGLYDWEGIHPVSPELWLLPKSAPMHPSRMWCHCRQVYLPMAWLYGSRSTGPLTPLIRALRDELYQGRYGSIRWAEHRDTVSPADDYRPVTLAQRATNKALAAAEKAVVKTLRQRALDECLTHIVFEDRVTNDIDIGPVNAVLNTVVHHFRGKEGEADFQRGFEALQVYLWQGHDGLKMQGYNNSELWDTAFAVQAMLAAPSPVQSLAAPTLERAYQFIRDNQILEDVPEAEKHYRHASKGGWPFSNRAHGWPITDCTAEGLKCALALEGRYENEIPLDLLRDSVRLILSWQNDDGGWATYEKTRGPKWLELLNPSQVFGDIMIDYSYVECTSACLQALAKARRRFRGEMDEAVDRAIDKGLAFLRSQQRPDGSFEGSWAVCFTYGTWFAVTGMLAAGVSTTDPAIRRACDFLVLQQKGDGSWGEAGDSCRERKYLQADSGQVAQTSWALLALVRARDPRTALQRHAVEFLTKRQRTDGAWDREPLVGVFNRTCLINYDNYRHYFPLWAMGEWESIQR